MAREHISAADRFIAVMGDIQRMDHGMQDGAEERFAVWQMKDAAEAVIADALMAAKRYVLACHSIRCAARDIRDATSSMKEG